MAISLPKKLTEKDQKFAKDAVATFIRITTGTKTHAPVVFQVEGNSISVPRK